MTSTSTPQTELPPIRACIFDMDGLLIDSEDIYTLCTNIVLHEYGRPDLPWNIKAQLQGRPGPEAGAIFHRWAQLPLTREAYMSKISILQREHFPSTRPLPGVIDLLSTLSKNTSPRIHIALATSSHSANFRLKTAHLLDLFQVFPRNQLVLGDDERIPRGKGKPAPDIYLLALECINEAIREENGNQVRLVEPNECLVFEDSVPGVEAGRRAGMRVVWVPHEGLLNEYRGREKEVLAGLTGTILEHRAERMGTTREELAAEVKVDVKGKEQTTGSLVEGQPGRIDDGWADLLGGLEDFPYSRYGINVVSVPP